MRTLPALALLGAIVIGGCAPANYAPASSAQAAATPPVSVASPVAVERVIDVYKSPSCTCCHEWEAYLRSLGWTVRSHPTEDMSAIKTEHGLPKAAWSCHTAIVAGYAIEGHVPVAAIEDLLATRPAIDGIALPGMPAGSPGMGGEQEGPFEVLAVANGATSVFGSY